jgi:hypothetical protein
MATLDNFILPNFSYLREKIQMKRKQHKHIPKTLPRTIAAISLLANVLSLSLDEDDESEWSKEKLIKLHVAFNNCVAF